MAAAETKGGTARSTLPGVKARRDGGPGWDMKHRMYKREEKAAALPFDLCWFASNRKSGGAE